MRVLVHDQIGQVRRLSPPGCPTPSLTVSRPLESETIQQLGGPIGSVGPIFGPARAQNPLSGQCRGRIWLEPVRPGFHDEAQTLPARLRLLAGLDRFPLRPVAA